MTHVTALVLALFIIALVLADVLFNGANAIVFVGRKLLGLIEYLAVWR